MAVITERLKRAWNAFRGEERVRYYGAGSSDRPDRSRRRIQNERSIINSICNKIAVNCASVSIKHVRIDENEQYVSTINDYLNLVLNYRANVDQTGREFIQDAIESMLDEGVVALLPVYATEDPNRTDSYEVINSRTAKILEWYPKDLLVEFYNEETGQRQTAMVEKRYTPIIQNPFYAIMNEPNSIFQRLVRVLNQLDKTNEQNSSGKLDIFVQLPYTLKGDMKKIQAENRLREIETQLTGSQHGIAYIDATERVIQLNRPAENTLWAQAKELQDDLFSQMGISKSVFDGTADELTMTNFYNNTIKPILRAFTEAIEVKWISRTAYSQFQRIRFFRDPFESVPISQLGDVASKFTTNEIVTSNEVRASIGMKPSDDPKADELRNSNINQIDSKQDVTVEKEKTEVKSDKLNIPDNILNMRV